MNKSTYESHEFLEVDDDDHQFLVVQDNGTFLINRPIQYLNEVQDVNAVLEDVKLVYDEGAKQFYVNTENSEDLITDQFVVTNTENNVCSNGYYTESVECLKEELIEDDIIEHNDINDTQDSSTTESTDNRLSGNCTEITISDEQYQLLQDKGWLLLETNDKVFVLDTLGLHDITDNKKMIEKLRSGVESYNEEEVTSSFKNSESVPCAKINSLKDNDYDLAEDLMDVGETAQNISTGFIVSQNDYDDAPAHIAQANKNTRKNSQPSRSPIRVKTKHLFKDIPQEIVLGRTVNGKKLVARVVKTDKPLYESGASGANGVETQPEQTASQTGLSEVKFENVIRQTLNGTAKRSSSGDVIAAERVVEQLLRVPAFRPAVMDRMLIITKIIQLANGQGRSYSESCPTLVSGQVTQETPGSWRFTYDPDLVRKLLQVEEENVLSRTKEPNEGSFLHIHINEMKGADGIVRVSITLNKRHLPLPIMKELNICQPCTVFACSSCADVFDTVEELKTHQEVGCMTVETNDLIDVTENTDISYTIINKTGKEKTYVCNQCQSRFTKLKYCQKHIKTHFNRNIENSTMEGEINVNEAKIEKVYKCKMCPCAYFHAATLSKHIVSKHIKVRTK